MNQVSKLSLSTGCSAIVVARRTCTTAEEATGVIAFFGGRLFDTPSYEGFFQTDREGRPKGVIALDPKELTTTSGKSHDSK